MKINKIEQIKTIIFFVLIVMLIGASYAYFTASVSTTNDQNKTTNIYTVEFANATMDLGDKVVVCLTWI